MFNTRSRFVNPFEVLRVVPARLFAIRTLARQAKAHQWAFLLVVFGLVVLAAMPATAEAHDDYADDTSTTGTVAVGGSQTGEIDFLGDVDWIKVTLVVGTRYMIDYEGSATGQGTLWNPYFHGVYDSSGNLISGTTNDNSGQGLNSRIEFTPSSSGTYFLGLGTHSPSYTGTYRVSVTEFDDYDFSCHIPGDDYENNTTTTGSVSVGGSAIGNLQQVASDDEYCAALLDRDWFRVTFDAGKTYRIDIRGSWTNHGTLRDTRIAGIYDSNGNLIDGTADENSGVDTEARTIFTAPTTGTYYISATRGEFPFPTQHSGTYTVEVDEVGDDDYAANTATSGSVAVGGSTTGTIERLGDLDWFEVTLPQANHSYEFNIQGIGTDWPLLEWKFVKGVYGSNDNLFAGTYTPEALDGQVRAIFTPAYDGTYYVAVGASELFSGTGEYLLSATNMGYTDVSDYVDTHAYVDVGGSIAGQVDLMVTEEGIQVRDRDWFAVTLRAGKTYRFDLEGSPTNQGTLRNPYLHGIYDSAGYLIYYTINDDGGEELNSRVYFTPDSDGIHYIAAGALYGQTGTYRLSVTEEQLTLSVSDGSGTESGGRIGFVVRLSGPTSARVTVDYSTRDGTATAGNDYEAVSERQLVFNVGKTVKIVWVELIDDTESDSGETFALELSNASGAQIADGTGVGTILNTEGALTASFPSSAYASASHSGATDSPQVVVTFSDAVAAIGADTPSVRVSGGSVSGVVRHTKEDLGNAWLFLVTPSGTGDVTFELLAGQPCDAGGICTAGGTPLAVVPEARTIPGPGNGDEADQNAAELSAEFPASRFMSSSHSGANDRPQVVVEFSAAVSSIGKSTPSMSVTGGTVKAVWSHNTEDGLSNAWIFIVSPEGNGDVTFELVAGAACDSGGICTSGGTQLTQVPEARTVPGQGGGDEAEQNAPATGLPTISGTAQVGETLTAGITGIADADGLNNVSYSYQWIRDDGGTDADIQDATGDTYMLKEADEGKTIKVRVSFTDDANNPETLTSAATAAVTARPNSPATGAPTISGMAQVDETLTASPSGIADEDGLGNPGFSYQWIRNDGSDDTDIQDATASTYTLRDADEGKTIRVRVSFTDDANNPETLTSAATGVVATRPNNRPTGLPTISGTAQVDETLTADTTDIADEDGLDNANASFTYQWIRNDGSDAADIQDETGQTYTVRDADVGKTIQVRVSFTDDASNEETLTSAATAAVTARPNSAATGAPTISGTVQVDKTLTAVTSGIADADGLTNPSFSYQWIRNDGSEDTDIQDATASTYTLVSTDEGKTIKVRVSFTDDANIQETLTSAATAAVAARPNNAATGAPTITGTAQVDETLTASTSAIADEDGLTNPSFSYQWIRNDGNTDADIQDATASTYTLVSTDEGKTIKVRVSFIDDANIQETLTSAATAAVAALPNSPATGQPTITGTAQVDETLTANTSGIADEDGLTNPSFSYQWIRNDGSEDTDIQDATASTYTLVSTDEGKTIKVRVSFTDDATNPETLISAATVAVADLPPEPLTASLENTPDSHNGSDEFTFDLRFSEDVKLSYKTLREHSFTVTGGTVKKAKRQDTGSNILWRITVAPDSDADVTLILPATEDCDNEGAICTKDGGRPLSNRLELTVRGPGQ